MLEVNLERRLGATPIAAQFSVPTGACTALFGRSGSGKTSVINMIAGLLRPDKGRIGLGGEVLFDSERGVDLPPEKRRIGYVFQDARLFPHLSVRGNLNYGAKSEQGDRSAHFARVVELLDLGKLLDRKPGRLSGGEQSRVGIGRALLSSPRLLLLDEPLASLDAERKAEILPYLERLRDEMQLPMVFASHAFEEVVRLAANLVVLDKGQMVAQGAVGELAPRLDFGAISGADESGAVIEAIVLRHDAQFGLSEIECQGARLMLPRLNRPVGGRVKLHIRARDVSLALARPSGISVLNVLEASIVEMAPAAGNGCDVSLDAGFRLRARISQKSAHDLKLAPGLKVYALIKTLSFDHALPQAQALSPNADAAGEAWS